MGLSYRLNQNAPNPFDQTTTINYFVPENTAGAKTYIEIVNIEGKVVKSETIAQRGHGSMTIHADELPAGMYIYSLYVGNNKVSSKEMMLTK
ncbi:MAG: T9SS type A sorting domain-containing protein [Chitinophagales bacterium]|nr:T9SS type A sorting domain-containing protein [Bacteroidota bacterium]